MANVDSGRTPLAAVAIPPAATNQFVDAIGAIFEFDDLAIVLAKLYNRSWIDDVANRGSPKNQMIQAVLLGLEKDPDLVGPFLGLLYRDGRCVDPLRKLINDLVPNIEAALVDAAKQADAIGEALQRMQQHLVDENVRTAVRNSKRAYEDFSSAAVRLLIYKSLHDYLQKEQKRNFPNLYIDAARAAIDPESRQEIVAFAGFIGDLLDNIDERLNGFSSVDDRQNQARWVDELREAHQQMRTSLGNDDKLGAITALTAVEQILREEPGRLNGQIVVVMGSLPLIALRSALVEAATAFPPDSADLLRAAQLVDGLRLQLTERVNEHALWQRADRILWKVEQEIARGAGFNADVLFSLWTGLKRQVFNLVRGEPNNPSTIAITKYSDIFDDAWVTYSGARAPDEVVKARAWLPTRFFDYRLEVINRFYQIDRNLKRDCAVVAAIGGSIDSLLGELNDDK